MGTEAEGEEGIQPCVLPQESGEVAREATRTVRGEAAEVATWAQRPLQNQNQKVL